MKAVGHTQRRTLDDSRYLQDLDIAAPTPRPHDLCAHVHVIAVNPIDLKVYRGKRATTDRHFGELKAVNLTTAHRFVAGGHAIGKAVLGGFG